MGDGINVLSLFDGISCGMVALERAGIKVNKYYASEIDKFAIQVSKDNYPNIIQLGDVTKWKEWNIDWASIDLLIGGSPCQGFSLAGKQLNFEDSRSKLFFEYVNILEHTKSLNSNMKFLLENVVMKKQYIDIISGYLGVWPMLIDAALVSAQFRKRNYWANWKISQPQDNHIILSDIIEDGIVEKAKAYCLTCRSGNTRDYFKKSQSNIVFIPCELTGRYVVKNGTISIVFKKSPDRSVHTYNVCLPNGLYNIRAMSEIECERLQGLPDNYTKVCPKTQRYNQVGNGWNIDVITHIFNHLKPLLCGN